MRRPRVRLTLGRRHVGFRGEAVMVRQPKPAGSVANDPEQTWPPLRLPLRRGVNRRSVAVGEKQAPLQTASVQVLRNTRRFEEIARGRDKKLQPTN